MEIFERLFVGDVVLMRKAHPCGGLEWQVVRVGADIGLVCLTCKRRVMMPRRQFARQARRFLRRPPEAEVEADERNLAPGESKSPGNKGNKGNNSEVDHAA